MNSRIARLTLTLACVLPLSACQAEDAATVYADKCVGCHGDMGRFAKRSLALADAAPVLRHGEKLEAFLTHHGRLSSGEIAAVSKVLADQLKTPIVR